MSRKGNRFDNAPMESFWGTLKNELVYHRRHATREQAIRKIVEYIEVFLGYLSPVAYARRCYEERRAA
jgi:DNA phosphorothioation-dependent restriction protein DptG